MTPPPSRAANPFATCWTRPGALPYAETQDACVREIVPRLAAAGWRGQIVGEHGSGKSTLLLEIESQLREQRVTRFRYDVTADQGPPEAPRGALLLVEGFERLSGRERSAAFRCWRARGLGFVVTTHRPLRSFLRPLAVLARLRPGEGLLRQLYEQLTADRSTPVEWEDARRAFARRRGELREVWFDLYDLHERRTRGERTVPVVVSYTEAGRVG